MNNTPTIIEFFNLIDPNGQIDREQALNDILLITLLTAFRRAKDILPIEGQTEMEKVLSNPDESFLKNVYAVYESSGKLSEFVEISEQIAVEVRKEYIKTQIKALNEIDRNKIFEKFPELKSVSAL